jgi:hypothetical protein
MGHVFISYAHADSAFVDKLVQALSSHGIATWVDRFQLKPGSNWQDESTQAFTEADALIFVISANSAMSSWVRQEIQFAILQRQTGSHKPIIPVLIGQPSIVPLELQSIQWLDFTPDFERALQELIEALPVTVHQSQGAQTPPTLMAKGYFFLSYVEEDTEFVLGLRQFMRDQQYGYWDFQESDRDYGLQFWREIEDKIDQSAAVLSILSPDWLLSTWTPREFLYAEEAQIPTFLLRIRQTRPSILTVGKTYIDFVSDTGKGFKKMEKELRKKRL